MSKAKTKTKRAARRIAVADCVCRKETRLLDHGCDYPRETCLSFGVAAEYYIENGELFPYIKNLRKELPIKDEIYSTKA